MLNRNEELKTALLCVVALLVGLLCVVLTGCDKLIDGEPHFDVVIPQSKYEMHDLTYLVNEYRKYYIACRVANLLLKRGILSLSRLHSSECSRFFNWWLYYLMYVVGCGRVSYSIKNRNGPARRPLCGGVKITTFILRKYWN